MSLILILNSCGDCGKRKRGREDCECVMDFVDTSLFREFGISGDERSRSDSSSLAKSEKDIKKPILDHLIGFTLFFARQKCGSLTFLRVSHHFGNSEL